MTEVADGVRRLTAPNPGPMTATGTHTFVLGKGAVVVVDPGPARNGGHVERLIAALGSERIAGIALTHRHADHAGAVDELASRTGATLLSDRQLAEHGIAVLPAAGHTSDHLCFRHDGILLTGDHVFEESSTLIDWPDGSLSDFLDTTSALAAFASLAFHPAHGPPLSHPRGRLEWLIRHREARNSAILDVIAAAPADAEAIWRAVYADTPAFLKDAALRNLGAHLEHLERAGRILAGPSMTGPKYSLAAAD